jgi:hypothetical protein
METSSSLARNPIPRYKACLLTVSQLVFVLCVGLLETNTVAQKKATTLKNILGSHSVKNSGSIKDPSTYWASPTGTASWGSARSRSPLSGAFCCSLSTANTNVRPGDTVCLRGGLYNTHIYPASSGTSGSRISYRAYNGELVVIRNTTTTYSTYYHGVCLIARSYITVAGVKVDNPLEKVGRLGRPFMITKGGSYNELKDCEFDGNGGGAIQIWRGSPDYPPATHNWIHGCTIHSTGSLVYDGIVNDSGGMQIGVPSYDRSSSYNTIEDCTFYSGGHHNLETFTQYNVIKNCYFHHEGSIPNNTGKQPAFGPDSINPADAEGLWGNRNVQIEGNGATDPGVFNLIEGNRFGHSGPPPDDDGGDGISIAAPKNIFRFNYIFNSLNNGILMKSSYQGSADNNRIYNNTIYKSGRYKNSGPSWGWQGYNLRWYGRYVRTGNVIINNLMNTHGGRMDMNVNDGINRIENNWLTANGDPLFTDTDVSDPTAKTRPGLSLKGNSPCIDIGTHLTRTKGSGSNSTKLVIDDALFFQDGTWGSALTHAVTHFPDWIAIGTVGNIVKILFVDYATNTIILASPMTWPARAKIWLYSDSNGRRVLYGRAPDIGAYEHLCALIPR